MKLVTSAQMRQIDEMAIKKYQIPGLELMEKAGRGTAQVARKLLGESKNKKVFIFCGKGNNGGDGFVAGRYLTKAGCRIKFFLTGKQSELKQDALLNFKKVRSLKLPVKEILSLNHLPELADCDLIIDALFGTGFKGELTGIEKSIAERINSSKKLVLAIDVPSGLDADNGKVSSTCIQAQATATMGLPKIGQFFFPGKKYAGKVEVINIGIPEEVLEKQNLKLNLVTPEEVRKVLPERPKDGHKGTFGKVFLLAGSSGMTGAAALASISTLRTGAGMALLGVPQSLNFILEEKVTEVMTKPFPDVRKRGAFALRGLGEIKQYFKWADIFVIGPGIGQHFETVELVKRLMVQSSLPAIIDADGLNALAKDISILKEMKNTLILTPHIGELSRLSGKTVAEIEKDRIEISRNFVREYNLILVFKGAPTIVAAPDGEVFVNSTGNSGMATAGSGDVLTGIIAGLLAQKINLEKQKSLTQIASESAWAGVYIHGLSGDLAAADKTEYGVIAGDIQEKIPRALAQIINNKS